MARIAITPRQQKAIRISRTKWTLAGALVRELAIACVLLLFVGLLVVGVGKLRAVQQQNAPSVRVPGKGDVYFSALHFVSANEGWIAESKSSVAGPTFLYRTTDGGRSWQSQLTWDGPGPAQVRFSTDGSEGLVVGQGGVPLFQTTDGGAHWTRMALPPAINQVALLYFLDAREGWVIAYLNEATPGFAGVFHTADGGAHWFQTARLDVNQQFSYGRIGGSLQGSLIFHDSSTGWFPGGTYSGSNIPIVAPYMYVTHDGGKTWSVQILPTTSAVALDSSNASIGPPQFFNRLQGILVVTKFSAGGPGQAPGLQGTYAYSTIDGGSHWSDPQPLVLPRGATFIRPLVVVDASHWFIVAGPRIESTTDGGRHWAALVGWPASDENVVAIEFQNADVGWVEVVGSGAHPSLAVYRTTDGGAHWSRFSAPDIGA